MTPINCPTVQTLDQILPDEPLLMMGAGPVPIPAPVAYANSLVINHLGPVMGKVLNQVKDMARYVFQTNTPYILGVAGPGSATMEMAMANLLEPGDHMLAVCNGYFSSRMADMARRVGAVVTEHMVAGTQCADPQAVLQQVRALQPKVITLVQGETSNTVWNRYLPEIARGASELGCLVVVDAVCTLSTMPLNMDDWGIDAVLTGGQKGLSSIPGVSLVAFSERAFAAIRQRRAPQTHWCLDAQMAYGFWSEGQYHYTAPTSGILALHEALRLVCLETLEGRFARHLSCSEALQAGIEGLGLSLFVDKCRAQGGNFGLVRQPHCAHRPDGRAKPGTPPVPHPARTWQRDAQTGRCHRPAGRHERAGKKPVQPALKRATEGGPDRRGHA